MRIINILFISIIKVYQKYISPLSAPSCRFYPSCSNYAITTFKFNNPFIAFFVVCYRILRCQPLCKDGFDFATTNKLPKANILHTSKTCIKYSLLPRKGLKPQGKQNKRNKQNIYLFLPLKCEAKTKTNSKKYKIIQTII